jgi:hypothetical protein
MGLAASLREPSHTNPGPVQSCLTDHSIAKTDVHLDMQEGMQYDHKAASSAVFTLLYALMSLLCSLFRMSWQDSGPVIQLEEIATYMLQHNVQRV